GGGRRLRRRQGWKPAESGAAWHDPGPPVPDGSDAQASDPPALAVRAGTRSHGGRASAPGGSLGAYASPSSAGNRSSGRRLRENASIEVLLVDRDGRRARAEVPDRLDAERADRRPCEADEEPADHIGRIVDAQ